MGGTVEGKEYCTVAKQMPWQMDVERVSTYIVGESVECDRLHGICHGPFILALCGLKADGGEKRESGGGECHCH